MSNSNLVKRNSHGTVPMEYEKNPVGMFPVVLLYEGIPYQLVKEKQVTENNPCRLCDLRSECNFKGSLSCLCSPDGRDGSWFFKEDWDIADRSIMDFLGRF